MIVPILDVRIAEFPNTLGNEHRDGCVTRHIHGRATHIEDSIDSKDQSEALFGNSDCSQNNNEHYHPRTRNRRRADRCESRGDDDRNLLFDTKIHTERLSNEYGRDGLVEARSVHVHRRADREHKAAHFFANAQVFFDAFHRHGQRRRAGTRRERK